jgi:hypothetical protein
MKARKRDSSEVNPEETFYHNYPQSTPSLNWEYGGVSLFL